MQADCVGGVWKYTDKIESDVLSPKGAYEVHSSMYKSLRTNLPRELMSYFDYPFVP